MGNTLTVQVCNPIEDLLEAAFYLAGRHATLFDGCVQVASRTVLHNFTPTLLFVLHEIYCLDDINVVQR